MHIKYARALKYHWSHFPSWPVKTVGFPRRASGGSPRLGCGGAGAPAWVRSVWTSCSRSRSLCAFAFLAWSASPRTAPSSVRCWASSRPNAANAIGRGVLVTHAPLPCSSAFSVTLFLHCFVSSQDGYERAGAPMHGGRAIFSAESLSRYASSTTFDLSPARCKHLRTLCRRRRSPIRPKCSPMSMDAY